MTNHLLTTREVAAMLALSPETVLRWHRSGKLPGGRRLGSNVLRFDAEETRRWLESCRDAQRGAAADAISGRPRSATNATDAGGSG